MLQNNVVHEALYLDDRIACNVQEVGGLRDLDDTERLPWMSSEGRQGAEGVKIKG